MSKEVAVKYPNSVCLFQFCRKVLDHKFGGIRVIDQDVGQILGFDPADCSHWKKGKKNIRSIQAIKAISDHLEVDDKLITDIASGEIDENEAFYEFTGYSQLSVDEALIEKARKEFYKKNASTWTRDKETEFRNNFSLQEGRIKALVEDIHNKVDFNEAPLYLPEISAAYPDVQLRATEGLEQIVEVEGTEKGSLIKFPGHEKMRPFIRYEIARGMSEYFFQKAGIDSPSELGDYAAEVRDVQANIFAVELLAPARLVRQELKNVSVAKDLVTQLAEIFWVSKAFMNSRLKEILQK